MITWAFAYMHVNGPHPIDGTTFAFTIVVDLFMVAMIAGAAHRRKNK